MNRSILALSASLCLLYFGLTNASAGVTLTLENYKSSMGDEALGTFCAQWDSLSSADLRACGQRLLPDLIQYVRGTPNGDLHILKFTNSEIVQRVNMLYLAEYQFWYASLLEECQGVQAEHASQEQVDVWNRSCERYERFLSASIERHGNLAERFPIKETDWQGEDEFDYLDLVASAAESTFDPAIYEEVWSFPNQSGLHAVYLALVKPDKTLSSLLGSTRGFQWQDMRGAEDTLFLADDGPGISLTSAFDLLQRLVEYNPVQRSTRSKQIREFIELHALYYAENREPKYVPVLDYMLRLKALQILKQIGRETDLAFIERLAENMPKERPPSFRQDFAADASIEALIADVNSSVRARQGQ